MTRDKIRYASGVEYHAVGDQEGRILEM